MLAGIACLSIGSCADDNISNQQEVGDLGATVSFDVSTAQENRLSQPQNAPATRAAIAARLSTEGLTLEDLAPRRHAVKGLAEACIVETTLEGVTPVLPTPGTRANVKTAIDARFTSSACRSNTQGDTQGKPEWFDNRPTNATGSLVTPLYWVWTQRYARFYSVFPEATTANGIAMTDGTHAGAPQVTFQVKQNVKDQVDLMTACSGEVEYTTRHQAPNTSLEFRHALTAVQFAVGQNLSWNKRITKVEIKNAYSKGVYTLPADKNTDGSWDDGSLTERKDFALDLSASPIDVNKAPNTVLMGNTGDNYTFYMIPQSLAGVSIVITLESTHPGSTAPNTITLNFTGGKWKPGTTKLYKLSQTSSDWSYDITVTKLPAAVAYNDNKSGTYGITSTRTAPDGTQRSAPWRVKEYSFDGGLTWVTTIPAGHWFKGLDKTEGGANFTTVGEEQGQATLDNGNLKDLLKERNDALKLDPKGTSSAYYDLSMHDIKGNARAARSTANCYVISHPGFYKLPLVYGNAITNGTTNTASYIYNGSLTDPNIGYVLKKFKDHAGADITNPWIEKTNGGANNGINGAQIVWEDEKDLVQNLAIDHDAAGDGYLQFEVKAEHIKSGNAVVAVKKGNTIVWSWHLWFAPDYVLDPIPVVNYSGSHTYKFSTENLGWKYTSWNGSAYQQPRSVKVRVEQLGGPKKQAEFTITQNPGSTKEGSNTFYQWGRKDAFPGGLTGNTAPTLYPAGQLFDKNAGDHMSITKGIQHPGSFYTWGTSWSGTPPTGYTYYNLWSANNTTTQQGYNTGNDLPVVKTVYDPSPVGFKLPANNAFTRFTTTGLNSTKAEEMNVQGTKDWNSFTTNFGWNFWTDGSNTSTIYFPASGLRGYNNGSLGDVKDAGYYWSAVPINVNIVCFLYFNSGIVSPLGPASRSYGFAVRPVTE